MRRLLSLFLGCCHDDYTFPQTPRPGKPKPRAALLTGTYVCCLNCGQEFAYSWAEMRITDERYIPLVLRFAHLLRFD